MLPPDRINYLRYISCHEPFCGDDRWLQDASMVSLWGRYIPAAHYRLATSVTRNASSIRPRYSMRGLTPFLPMIWERQRNPGMDTRCLVSRIAAISSTVYRFCWGQRERLCLGSHYRGGIGVGVRNFPQRGYFRASWGIYIVRANAN